MAVVQRYYFDALPIPPRPERLESFTSYLTRLAEMNGIRSMTGLAAVCSLENRPYGGTLRYLKDYPPLSFGDLELITGCSEARLLQTTFYHLGKKFGHSTETSLFPSFLSKSLASSLRYCSKCLNESLYYSLSWRFLMLRGCYKHNCKLFDKCTHCGHEIPFLALPLRTGICPACKGDLRLCMPEALTAEESREAFIFSQEIEFLVSPQSWEDTYTSVAKNIGREYALLRQVKGYAAANVKNRIGVKSASSSKVADIDFGRSKNATFKDYVIYANYLGASLQDIFNLMLTRTEGDACFEQIRREFLPPEDYILEKAQLIVDRLKSGGEQITRQAIREELRISESSLRKYPRVKFFLDQHAGVFHYRQKEHVQLRKNEVLDKVSEAIKHLGNLGEPITYNSVGKFIGIPAINLKANPQSVVLITNHRNFYDFRKKQHLRREAELLSQVQGVVRQMRSHGQAITRSAIAREVGVHLATLQWYEQIKKFLDREVDVPKNVREKVAQSRERENKILIQVENAVQQLEEKGQKISRKTIADAIGVSVDTLTRFPLVRLLLEEKVNFYQQVYMQSREDEILERVKRVIETLRTKGQKVTQQTIAREVGVTRVTFKQYPRVMRLLEENTRIQAQIHENEMMIKVKESIIILEENKCKITNGAICKQLSIPPANLHHYPSVIAFVQKYTKEKQKQYNDERLSLEEEKLVYSVPGAIQHHTNNKKRIKAEAYGSRTHQGPRRATPQPF
jgi:hypothetical protein